MTRFFVLCRVKSLKSTFKYCFLFLSLLAFSFYRVKAGCVYSQFIDRTFLSKEGFVMNNNQGSSSGLFSTLFATGGALALAAGGYIVAKHQEAPRPESKRKSERSAQKSPEVLEERLRHQKEKSALEKNLALLEHKFAGLKEAKQVFQEENTRLTIRLEQADAKEKTSSEQLATKETQLAEAKQTSDKQAEQIITLTESAEKKKTELSTGLAVAQEKVTSLELKFTNSQNELNALQGQLAAKESQLAEVTQTSTEQAQQISILNARVESAEVKEKKSSAELAVAQEKATSLELKFTNSQNELNALQGQLAAKESQLAEVTQTSTEQAQQISILNARVESAEAKEKKSSEQLVAAQEKATSLESNFANSQNELSALRDQLAVKESQLTEANETSANQAELYSKSIFGQLSESKRLQSDKKGRAHSFIGCLIQSDNPVLLKFVVAQLALSHGLTSRSLRGWLEKKYKDLSQKDRIEFKQCREKLFGDNIDALSMCSGLSLFSSNSRGGSPDTRTSHFDYIQQGRRASAPHIRVNSRASNVSLLSNQEQEEGRSLTSSFSQA
jgi:myosin heavy subunit